LEEARSSALAGDYASALQSLEGILSHSSEDIDARLLRAAIFQMMEDLVIARSEVLKALEIAPGNVRALIGLADLQEGEGDCEGALQTLAEAARRVRSGHAYLSREQELEEIVSAQWRCLHLGGQPQKAVAVLTEGLRELPTSTVLRGLMESRKSPPIQGQ
jgi:tetratricopeptide (TPR) repeat protein